ncbi:ribosome biogenesis factor YjgA [Salinibius halmophilus]|uniref:ribosome biogenesis factor YjgA n=1 Tax=Salinibius halmophilus TaxID=1853216 RepID=UPI000E673E48|nr:ribosome biogenesis factor YjgA [Salinibius halmophilus]
MSKRPFQDNPDYMQDDEDFGPSKSQVKREMHELQAIGERLLVLKDDQIANMPLTDELVVAIHDSRRITKNEARRRHLQYVGKLMRKADTEAIIHALDLLDPSSEAFQQQVALVEHWRNKLLTQDNASMAEFLDEYPSADRQHLRQLVRNVPVKADGPDLSHNSAKKLFKYLKSLLLN